VTARVGIERWWRFVRQSIKRGWGRAVAFSNHVGLVVLLAALAGAGALSWKSGNWWLVAVAALLEFWLILAVGAYDEWRSADRAIAEFLLPSFDSTIRQLEGERGRANVWLGTLKGSPSDSDIHNIDWLFDGFWLQTLEIILEPRAGDLWYRFSNPDHAVGDLEPVPADERERVYRKVRDAVQRLDAVIAEFHKTRKLLKDALAK
jgi:hypothetical protein